MQRIRDVEDCRTTDELVSSLTWKLERYEGMTPGELYRMLAWAERALDRIVSDSSIIDGAR